MFACAKIPGISRLKVDAVPCLVFPLSVHFPLLSFFLVFCLYPFYSFLPSSVAAGRGLSCPLLLALLVKQVSIPGGRPCELCTTIRAARLGGLARLLSLVSQKIAESRELAAVAAVFPALRLGSALDHADMACCVVGVLVRMWCVGRHHWWHRVHYWLVRHGSNGFLSAFCLFLLHGNKRPYP